MPSYIHDLVIAFASAAFPNKKGLVKSAGATESTLLDAVVAVGVVLITLEWPRPRPANKRGRLREAGSSLCMAVVRTDEQVAR